MKAVTIFLALLAFSQLVHSHGARRAPEGSTPGQAFNLQALTPSDFQFKGDSFVIKMYGQTHVIPVRESIDHFEVEVHEANGKIQTHVEEFFQYVGVGGYYASFLPLSGEKRSATSFQGNFFIGEQRFYVDEFRERHHEQMEEEVDAGSHMVVYTASEEDPRTGLKNGPLSAEMLAFPAGCTTMRTLNSSAVVDPEFYNFCTKEYKSTSGYVKAVKSMYSTASTVFNKNLNVKIGLYKTVLFKTASNSPIKANADISAHSSSFVNYVNKRKEKTQWNLFTGTFHSQGHVGVAGVGSLCLPPQSTVNQWWSVGGTANIWEHELGHTFGASHSSDNTIMCCCCAIPSPVSNFAASSKTAICGKIKDQGKCLKIRKAY